MNGFDLRDVEHLRCPTCKTPLEWLGKTHGNGRLHYGPLICERNHSWRVQSDLPDLIEQQQKNLKDQVVDVVYDCLAPIHDLSATYLLPIIQYPDKNSIRHNYMKMLELDALPEDREPPVRILEIGCGTGANFPLLRHHARKVRNLEIWAVDFNAHMVELCAQGQQHSQSLIRLALADAHSLPFADNTFDRVFHIGGINIYKDAAQGLDEMARVAKPDTPILVVDEGLDQDRDNNPLHHLAFFCLTSLDNFTGAPVDLVPQGCEVKEVKNISRFYYGMTFTKKPG